MQRHEMMKALTGLGLKGMAGAFDEAVTTGLQRNRTTMEILTDLLRAEATHRHAASVRYRMSAARLPGVKDLDAFVFDGTPINEGLVRSLHSGSFLTGCRNIVLVGGTGTGKTHLASAITANVVREGARGRYFNTVDLVNRLEEETRLGKAGALAAQLSRLEVVVLDELGYLPFARSGGQLLFHLVSKLYECTSVIVTTNLAFGEWPTVFGEGRVMAAARDRHRPGELPWGWWLRVIGDHLEDEGSRRWPSVHHAFWQTELGFCDVSFMPEQLELMLRVLLSVDMQGRGDAEIRYELFGGDMTFRAFYMCWLQSVGLLMRPGGLSPEGRSALLMLMATRDPEWEDLPFPDVIAAVVEASRGPSDRDQEKALRDFERCVGLRRHVFAREMVGKSHAITLTGMATERPARMPARRVTWSLVFDDVVVRDDLFAWIAARVDHWDHWGSMAYRRGADALTQHLLGLVVASRSSDP